jgi:hypothetical protein
VLAPLLHGSMNGNSSLGPAQLVTRAASALLRRPTLGLLRRYIDWVEQTSTTEVVGPGAAYAGQAVYVCRIEDLPILFLHRAHFDDRALLAPGARYHLLALYGRAAGIMVTRGEEPPPEIERAVRAGNGALFPVAPAEEGRRWATTAAGLAQRTGAPVIPLAARASQSLNLRWGGAVFTLPSPRARIELRYGPLLKAATGSVDELASQVLSVLGR